jgi:hypothetical protein
MSSRNSEALWRLALESDLYPHGISEEYWQVDAVHPKADGSAAPAVICLVRETERSEPAALELLRSIVEKGLGVPWAECRISSESPHPTAPVMIAFGVQHNLTVSVIETESLAELAGSREKKRVLWESLKSLRP